MDCVRWQSLCKKDRSSFNRQQVCGHVIFFETRLQKNQACLEEFIFQKIFSVELLLKWSFLINIDKGIISKLSDLPILRLPLIFYQCFEIKELMFAIFNLVWRVGTDGLRNFSSISGFAILVFVHSFLYSTDIDSICSRSAITLFQILLNFNLFDLFH